MKKIGCCLIFASMFFCMVDILHAACTGACVQYCGNGYCVDYVQYRLHVKQKGDAGEWYGNVSMNDVQSNDVAIFGPTPENSYGHVAVVDSVNGDNITISEWNWGSESSDPTERSCGVTINYNNLTTRTISKSSVTRFWRPDLGGSILENESIPVEIEFRTVGQIGWYPPNKTCVNASEWVRIADGRAIQSFGSNSACYSVGLEYLNNWEYQGVLFGTGDLPQECTQ